MNEEIRKNEISENDLEAVSGGAGGGGCPSCGGRVKLEFNPETNAFDKRVCMECGRKL